MLVKIGPKLTQKTTSRSAIYTNLSQQYLSGALLSGGSTSESIVEFLTTIDRKLHAYLHFIRLFGRLNAPSDLEKARHYPTVHSHFQQPFIDYSSSLISLKNHQSKTQRQNTRIMRAMNIILIQPLEWGSNGAQCRLLLTDRRAQHVYNVIRPKTGDALRVGLVNGKQGLAKVTLCTDKALELDVTLNQLPPPPLPMTLLLAMPRPKVFRRVLQSCTSLGVKDIYLINSYRVEKSYWQTPFLEQAAIQEQLMLGLEQARDCMLPTVHIRTLFKPFVEDELPQLCKGKRCFTAHPSDQATPCPSGIKQASVLAVGPEGGFIPYEIDKLQQSGFQTITLGQRVLKVETALPSLISKLFL